MSDKQDRYLQLVAARKACDLCKGLVNPSRCAGGKFDSNEIGVWSGWQGSLDALVMIVGQDWGSVENFEKQCGVDKASATIKTLCDLMALAGLGVELPSGRTHRGEIFTTITVLCLKPDSDQQDLRREWIANCSKHFLRQQIDIIQPKVVICLGMVATKAVLEVYGFKLKRFRDAVECKQPRELAGGIIILPVYHCGRRILSRHRPLAQQQQDWERIGAVIQKLRKERPATIVEDVFPPNKATVANPSI